MLCLMSLQSSLGHPRATSPGHGAEITLSTQGPQAPTAGTACTGSSHLLSPLCLRVVVQEGPFQHRGHDSEALPSLELRCEGQELRVHHILLLIPTDQHQQLRPGRRVLQSVPTASLSLPQKPPIPISLPSLTSSFWCAGAPPPIAAGRSGLHSGTGPGSHHPTPSPPCRNQQHIRHAHGSGHRAPHCHPGASWDKHPGGTEQPH